MKKPSLTTHKQVQHAPKGTHPVMAGLRFKSNGDGTGSWVGRYYMAGKETPMGLGPFPEVGLKDALEIHSENRVKVRMGTHPRIERDRAVQASVATLRTVEDVCREAYQAFIPEWKNGGAGNGFMPKLETYVFPVCGSKPIEAMDGDMIYSICAPMWQDRKSICDKILSHLSKILGWAAAKKIKVDRMAVRDARKLLGKSKYRETSQKALHWRDVPAHYASLGNSMSELAEKFYILAVCRTENAAALPWSELDAENGLWAIPRDRMKREDEQFIPITTQMQAILDKVPSLYLTDEFKNGFVFPSPSAWKTGHVSANNWSKKFRDAGVEATAHGMRSAFKNWSERHQIADRVDIEEALHHKQRPKQELAYLDPQEIAERRRPLLQAWADYVTGLSG